MRPRPLTLLVLAALGAACPFALAEGPSPAGGPPVERVPGGPRLVFESKTFDFGKAIAGSTVEHVYRFRNAGDRDLVIRRVKPACGCTAALLSSERVPPGGTGEIKVTFSAGERMGPQNLTVTVFSNDARELDQGGYVSILHFRGEVAHLLQVLPGNAYFATFRRGTPQERRITVLPGDAPAVAALALEPSKPWLKAEAHPLERGGRRGFEVRIAIAPEAPIGRIHERVTVRTDHPKQGTLVLPVVGVATGKVIVFPERLTLFFQDLAENEPSIFVSTAAMDGSQTLPAIDAVEAPPELLAETIEIVPGQRAEVRLKLRPGVRPGPFAGIVRIHLRDPEQPCFEVPVAGEIPRRVKVEPAGVWLVPGAAAEVVVSGARVIGVAVEGAPVEATLAADRSGRIALRARPDAPAGPFAGTLIVATDARGEEKIAVSLRGRIE